MYEGRNGCVTIERNLYMSMFIGARGNLTLGTTSYGPYSTFADSYYEFWGVQLVAGTTYDIDVSLGSPNEQLAINTQSPMGWYLRGPAVPDVPVHPTDTIILTPSVTGLYILTVSNPSSSERIMPAYSLTVTDSTFAPRTDGDITVFGLSRDDFMLNWVHGAGGAASTGIEKGHADLDGSVGVVLAPGFTSADLSHKLSGYASAPHIPGGANDSFLRIHCG